LGAITFLHLPVTHLHHHQHTKCATQFSLSDDSFSMMMWQ